MPAHRRLSYLLLPLGALALGTMSCGDSGPVDPTSVPYGQTTFVVFVNPVVNDINTAATPTPDPLRRDSVTVAVVLGDSEVTDSTGVVALSPVAAGTRTLSARRDSVSGTASVS